LHNASESWIGTINDELVCFAGVIQFPMRKGWKRVHRLVVLPDYQGIGIGTFFISTVAKFYTNNGYDIYITTSTPSISHSLIKSNEWALIRYGHSTHGKAKHEKYVSKSDSIKRITYSFHFKK